MRVTQATHAYPVLDMLRFGAALVVMLSHLRDQYFAPYGDTQCASTLFRTAFFLSTRLGTESVLLFFVLSGFLVGGISMEKSLAGRFSPWKYAVDRFTRIYTPLTPALLLALAICVAWRMPFGWGNFFVNLFSLQGVFGEPFPASGALWSLSYEVWFYILFGALIGLAKPGSRGLKAALVVASAFVFSRLDVVYLLVWVGGMAGYFTGHWKRPRIFLPAALAIVAIGVVLMQVTSVTVQADLSRFRFIDRSVAILVLGLGFAMLVPIAARVRFVSRRGVRVAKSGAFLAEFSYSLYLVHLPIEQVMLNMGLLHSHYVLNAETLAGYFGTAAGMLLAAYGFYFCFERQTGVFRKWLYGLGGMGRAS
jgi:peptidoglycan/LPS O-acetylase OafA/YrhL